MLSEKQIYEGLRVLESITWKLNRDRHRAKTLPAASGPCYSMVFGNVWECRSGLRPSLNTIEQPQVIAWLKKLASELKFEATAFQVNRNFRCLPHKDRGNIGFSVIVGFGDYKGGELIVGGQTHDIQHKPLLFDGTLIHETKPFTGTRYSVVMYNRRRPNNISRLL